MFRTLLLLLLLVMSLSPNYPGVSSVVLGPNADTLIPSTLYPIIYRLPENVRDIYRDETEKSTLTSTLRQASEPTERTSTPTPNSPLPSPKSTSAPQQQRPSQNTSQSNEDNNTPSQQQQQQQQQQDLPRKQQQQSNIPQSSSPDSPRNQQQQQQSSQTSVPTSSPTSSKEKNSSADEYDTSETSSSPFPSPSSSSSSPISTTKSSLPPSLPTPNRKAIVLILGVGAAVTIALVSTLFFFIRKKNKYSSSSTSFKNMLKPDDPYYAAKPSWADEVYIDPTTGEAFQPASDPPSSFRGGTSQPFRERVPTPDDYIPGYPPSSTVPEYATFASVDSKLSPENEQQPYGNRPPRPPFPPFARQPSH